MTCRLSYVIIIGGLKVNGDISSYMVCVYIYIYIYIYTKAKNIFGVKILPPSKGES